MCVTCVRDVAPTVAHALHDWCVWWFNTTRLLERLGYLPPAEFATQHYETITLQAMQAVA